MARWSVVEVSLAQEVCAALYMTQCGSIRSLRAERDQEPPPGRMRRPSGTDGPPQPTKKIAANIPVVASNGSPFGWPAGIETFPPRRSRRRSFHTFTSQNQNPEQTIRHPIGCTLIDLRPAEVRGRRFIQGQRRSGKDLRAWCSLRPL